MEHSAHKKFGKSMVKAGESPLFQEYRMQVAKDTRAFIVGDMTWDQFILAHGDTDDKAVGNLVDIIRHEPKRGGFLGVSEDAWESYVDARESAIRALERT